MARTNAKKKNPSVKKVKKHSNIKKPQRNTRSTVLKKCNLLENTNNEEENTKSIEPPLPNFIDQGESTNSDNSNKNSPLDKTQKFNDILIKSNPDYKNSSSSIVDIIEIKDDSYCSIIDHRIEKNEEKNTNSIEVIEILDTTVTPNKKPIECIVLSDSEDENSSTEPLNTNSHNEHLREIPLFNKRPIHERLGCLINKTNTRPKPYQSPLRHIKNKVKNAILPNALLTVNSSLCINDRNGYSDMRLQQPITSSPCENRKLRPVIIDGLNIGFAHGSGTFSVKGIDLCVKYFVERGHREITVFIPQHRQGPPGSEVHNTLNSLHKQGYICFTPSRKVQNIRMTCYDDRIMLNYAHGCGGVVVSNDNYRDLYNESPDFRNIIENRHVMVTFVRDTIIVPEDQYNRKSMVQSLSDILCFPPDS
ncbi:NEDD4-binding protein 1-like [Daktulosphaira vitifoliae]|uniref:NEDD4-binding protein 1-like n=1 Tax=Daktulosphaira vitifoliae TaxID=58002 RepID=UPI0021A99141|nr:NEDD4-binding protein 1-like [Daktulosphaira vitifoliae]XP_050541794.1 NEDD4-binding protein 1-like [Daktulosphaira vitifoliae]XP_050541795.1 NEDD4-binding protein 1-like [Daktulosphaira vitifoliae]